MRVTSIQLDSGERPKAAVVADAQARVAEAAAGGADLVLLPEIWPTGYFGFDRYEQDAEPLDGPTVKAMEQAAREGGCHVFMGSLVERDQYDGKRLFNTSVLIGPAGTVLTTYRKIHLFGYESRERQLLAAGRDVVVARTELGALGLSTCYDLRFPELYRKMMAAGAEVFLVASAWPAARVEAWRLFNRARAHENLAFLVSCNAAGLGGATKLAGHSMVVSPMGEVRAEADDGPQLLSAEIDLAEVAAARRQFPALEDRVFDV
jgi:predicted amidohydrolase